MFYNMVSITLSVPDEIKKKMAHFAEINWSGFIRKKIIEKAAELTWKEQMLEKLKQGAHTQDWAVDLQKKARKDRAAVLKTKGLI